MNDKIWDNLCNKKFVNHFSPPKLRKYFLQLSYFRKQGYDEKSAIKGLETKDIVQWKDTHYKAGYNSEKSVAEDLHKTKTGKNEDSDEYLPPASEYDPRINYDELAWKAYYKAHKGEPFAEEAKKIIESLH